MKILKERKKQKKYFSVGFGGGYSFRIWEGEFIEVQSLILNILLEHPKKVFFGSLYKTSCTLLIKEQPRIKDICPNSSERLLRHLTSKEAHTYVCKKLKEGGIKTHNRKPPLEKFVYIRFERASRFIVYGEKAEDVWSLVETVFRTHPKDVFKRDPEEKQSRVIIGEGPTFTGKKHYIVKTLSFITPQDAAKYFITNYKKVEKGGIKPRSQRINTTISFMKGYSKTFYDKKGDWVYKLFKGVFENHPAKVFQRGKDTRITVAIREVPRSSKGIYSYQKTRVLRHLEAEEAYYYFIKNYKKYVTP